MAEKNAKFPIFFTLMLIALSVLMLISIFFSSTFVGVLFFIALLVVIVFTILDKKYGTKLASHEDYYLFVDIICFIAVSAIVYYEEPNQSKLLKLFLGFLMAGILILILLDFLYFKDEYFVKKECLYIDIAEICSMICILAYFYRVSEFWFAVVGLAFCLINIAIKITFTVLARKKSKINPELAEKTRETQKDLVSIEERIQSNNEQGDME